ncbi:MAG: nucleoside triphosphate pyrophosphohydrolase [Deltaproteobacteria bacterium]|nr:nucleoside triphosphate pyrophosphohydrolase [Deltaproteobacteria bacterium]NNK83935.1 nucleoside triphosphate pyrophosphohydrolase [Desulfobacterales bacterium]
MENFPVKKKSSHRKKALENLIRLIETLRGENGCPWDREQTPETLAIYLVEEIYELLDAIESGTPQEVCEELGDVLFQIFFMADLFHDMGHFDIYDTASKNTEKMIRRHPHVFANVETKSTDEIRERWHKIKMQEKNKSRAVSVLDSVPVKLPALMRAYRISERAAATGFDWDNISSVMEKVEEELSEFNSALVNKNDEVAMEFGDILFTLVNVARFARIHPETALTVSIKKFEKRFKYMEKQLSEKQKHIENLTPVEIKRLWEEAKRFYDRNY